MIANVTAPNVRVTFKTRAIHPFHEAEQSTAMAAQLTDAAVRQEEAVLALSAFVSDDATGTTGGAIALRQGPLARWAARFSNRRVHGAR